MVGQRSVRASISLRLRLAHGCETPPCDLAVNIHHYFDSNWTVMCACMCACVRAHLHTYGFVDDHTESQMPEQCICFSNQIMSDNKSFSVLRSNLVKSGMQRGINQPHPPLPSCRIMNHRLGSGPDPGVTRLYTTTSSQNNLLADRRQRHAEGPGDPSS